MDSMDLIYTSMFLNTGQKRASSSSLRNFPLPLPNHKASDKSKPREGEGGSGAPEANLVALLTQRSRGRCASAWAQGRFSPYGAVEKERENRATEPPFGEVQHALLPHGSLICWPASERGNTAKASTWPIWGSTRAVHLICQGQRKEMLLFPLQRVSQQPQPRARPSMCIIQSHGARQFLPQGVPVEQRWAEKRATQGSILLSIILFIWWLALPVPSTPQGTGKHNLPQNIAKLEDTFWGGSFSVLEMYNTLMKENWSVNCSAKMKSLHPGRGSPTMHLKADLQRPGTEDGKAPYLHGDLMIQS